MATCSFCEREMTTAASCGVEHFHRGGEPVALPRYGRRGGSLFSTGIRCGDCGVTRGGVHHPGCDIARCPICGGQMFACGCRFDEDGPDDDLVDNDLEDEDEILDTHADRVRRAGP